MKKKAGLLGGTFNPVHTGHLVMAADAVEKFKLDEMLFVPCASPPHKKAHHLAPARHRVAMLRAAVKGDPRFHVCTLEVDRGGTSYSVDTLRELRLKRPDDRFFFVIGSDTLHELHTWKDIYELLTLCTFVCAERPGSIRRWSPGALWLKSPWPARLLSGLFRGHLVDLSSSEIRQRVTEGRSIRYLVPAGVERYILKHRLYKRELRTSTHVR